MADLYAHPVKKPEIFAFFIENTPPTGPAERFWSHRGIIHNFQTTGAIYSKLISISLKAWRLYTKTHLNCQKINFLSHSKVFKNIISHD